MKGLKGKAKSLLRHALSIAVSAALLAFVFAGADFEQLARTLRAVRPGWLLLAGALLVVADLLMALKCWVLRRSMSVRGTILSYCRMRFFSLLPGGNITGEAARLMYLRNMTDGYVATTLMIIDKQTQMIPQQTLCLIGLMLAGARGHWIFFGLSGFTLGWALLVPGSLFIPSARRTALRIAAWLDRLRFRWGAVAAEELRLLCGACESLADQRGTVLAHLLLGLASDLLLIGAQALIGHALGFSIALTDWLWINGIVSIAMCLPFSVGGIGLREGAMTSLLALFGVQRSAGMLLPLTVSSLTLLKGLTEGAVEAVVAHRAKRRRKDKKI